MLTIHDAGYATEFLPSIDYGREYFQKYRSYESTPIACRLNAFRRNLTEMYIPTWRGKLLDIGIGSGEFIKSAIQDVWGYDINPFGVKWLRREKRFFNPYKRDPKVFDGVTFWDSLEHIPDPAPLLARLAGYVFISMPIFDDLTRIKQSRHYRPGEHFFYFTSSGLTSFMGNFGFELREQSDGETKAGRDSIGSFVFYKLK